MGDANQALSEEVVVVGWDWRSFVWYAIASLLIGCFLYIILMVG